MFTTIITSTRKKQIADNGQYDKKSSSYELSVLFKKFLPDLDPMFYHQEEHISLHKSFA